MTSRIIAIEGIDASGKSTQTQLLADRFIARGQTVEVRSFPRYQTFFGQRIRALLDGTESDTATTLDPRSMALWFAMDRWQSFSTPCTADVLLLNRYTLSNAVYQAARSTGDRRYGGAEGDQLFSWILQLEHEELGLPVPDLTVVLDVDVATSTQRSTSRAAGQGTGPDVYERAGDLLVNSRQRYVDAAALVANLHVIAVTGRAADDVADDVWALVS